MSAGTVRLGRRRRAMELVADGRALGLVVDGAGATLPVVDGAGATLPLPGPAVIVGGEAAGRLGRLCADRLLLLASFAAVYLIWGSTYLAIAWGIATIPPLTMIAARSLLAGVVLYAIARRHAPAPAAADWRRAIGAGVLLFVTGQAMLAWGETRVPSGAAAVLVATEPLFIALLAWRFRDAARPSAKTTVALVAGFLGVAVMMLPGELGGVDALGAIAVVLATLSWSTGVLLAAPRPGLSPVQAAAMQLVAGGMVLAIVAMVSGDLAGLDPAAVSTRSLLSFLYLVVFGSLVTYSAYVWLLRRVGPSRLASHAYVNPVVAVGLGALLAGEPMTVAVLLAGGMVLVAVAVLVRK